MRAAAWTRSEVQRSFVRWPRRFLASLWIEPAATNGTWARAYKYGALGAAGVASVMLTGNQLQAKTLGTQQEVYVWGRAQGIPGGANRDVLRPQRIKWFEKNPAGWAKLALGPNFGAALDNKGCMFVWCEGSDNVFVGPIPVDMNGELSKHRIIDVQCSAAKIFILTRAGLVFVVDEPVEAMNKYASGAESAELPMRMQAGLPQHRRLNFIWQSDGVKQMSIGLEHGAFVTHKGALYCVGGSQWGQCGVEPPRQKGPMGAVEERARIEVADPVQVRFPESAGPIEFVEVGGRHTIAVDVCGRVFSFGDDRRIQLGLGDTRSTGNDDRHAVGVLNRDFLGGKKPNAEMKRAASYRFYDSHMQASPMEALSPPAANRPEYPPPSFMACGEDFTLAVHRDSPDWYSSEQETNTVFCCGENGDGQCGRSLQQQQQTWCAARMPKRSRTVAVACGQAHSLALLHTGELFAWGENRNGQVGTGSRASVAQPTKLLLGAAVNEEERLEQEVPRTVTYISCGFRNSAAICELPLPA